MEQSDSARLLKAATFAAFKHRKQRRKDGEGTPYINHPLGVAKYIADAAVDDIEVLEAAILHDTLEDTETLPEELERHFGSGVLGLVEECSDDKTLPKDVRKRLQIEHAPHVSHRARLIKLADKLHNCNDLLVSHPATWDAERIQGYFCWSHAFVEACKGTNRCLEEQLERMFSSEFEVAGVKHPALVSAEQRAVVLEKYYESMAVVDD